MSKQQKKTKPTVNSEIEGFEVNVNSFGEIKSSLKIDELNKFLDKNVEDKKLKDRKDLNKST